MNNPIEIIVKNIMRQGEGNLQAVAQNIVRNNPQFAQKLQGQNLQDMAFQEMRRSGIEPRMFMNNMFGQK